MAQKRRFADSLAAELGAIREAAGPLRAALSAAPPGAALPDRAEQLPLPLYVVLTQLLATKVSFATAAISVSCRGGRRQAWRCRYGGTSCRYGGTNCHRRCAWRLVFNSKNTYKRKK